MPRKILPAIRRLAPGPEEKEKGKKMDRETLIRAILECNFAGYDSDIIDIAVKRIMESTGDVIVRSKDAEPMVWIPITARPMDTEERLEWSEKLGYDLEDVEALIYTLQPPDDGQEVLVCGRNGRVWIDKFMNDPDYGCYFEENGDMDGIVAWMPLPKPYRER